MKPRSRQQSRAAPASQTRGRWRGLLTALLLLAGTAGTAAAQPITFDGSIGPAAGETPFFQPASSTWFIFSDDGDFGGGNTNGNLFFSFANFNVPEGQVARFLPNNSFVDRPQRIISRVTETKSYIDGLVRSDFFGPPGSSMGPDFFLLNPRGIVVGPGGSFMVGNGSVFLSSADRLNFGDDEEFFATDPDEPGTVLSDLDATSFGFLVGGPAAIVLNQPSLAFGTGLTLVGGDVQITGEDSLSVTTISAQGGSVRIAAVQGGSVANEVQVPIDVRSFDPSLFAADQLAVITLDDVHIDVRSGVMTGSGGVVIRGGELVMRGGTIDSAANTLAPSELDAFDAELGTSARFEEGAAVFTGLNSVATSGGPIRITAPTVELVGSADPTVRDTQLQTRTLGPGDAPEIAIRADTLTVSGRAGLFSETSGAGRGGKITVTAQDELAVTAGGSILSAAVASASGRGGDIEITDEGAGSRVLLQTADGDPRISQISALSISNDPDGGSGDLTIDAAIIEIRDGAQVRGTTSGAAAAGALELRATDRISVGGSSTLADASEIDAGVFALTSGSGAGGSILLSAPLIEILDAGTLSASSQGFAPDAGSPGEIRLEDAERILLRGGDEGVGQILTETVTASGAGGGITIGTVDTPIGMLELRDGGVVSASTFGDGDASDIAIFARSVEIAGIRDATGEESGLFAKSGSGSTSAGDAGDITVVALESLALRDGALIAVNSLQNSNAGAIDLSTARLSVDGATITTTAANGDGGPVTISASEQVALVDAAITTAADFGAGGNIDIETPGSLLAARTQISTEASQAEGGGTVFIGVGGIAYFSDATVTTTVPFGVGDGGNTDITGVPLRDANNNVVRDTEGNAILTDTLDVLVLNRSTVKANAVLDDGGDLRLAAGEFLPSDETVLSATSELGLPGTIVVDAPATDLVGQITPLPASYIDASKLMNTPCAARRERTGSFTIQTRATAEPAPDAPFSAPVDVTGADGSPIGPEECPL